MNHHLTTDDLIDFLHGELNPSADARVHVHLQACAECRTELEAESGLTAALRTAAANELVEMPALVKAHIWGTIRAAKPGPIAQLRAFLRPAVAIPALTVLAIAAFFGLPAIHVSTPADLTIDAAYYLDAHRAIQLQNPLSERNLSPRTIQVATLASTDLADLSGIPAVAGAADVGR